MHLRRIQPFHPDPHAPIVSQLLALQVIRRSLAAPPGEGSAWRTVGDAFRLAHARMLAAQHIGLVVSREGALLPTRHERRLLRATAAAQRPDPALTDNYLFSLAPGRDLRPLLADAIARLAATLAEHGHQLPLTRA